VFAVPETARAQLSALQTPRPQRMFALADAAKRHKETAYVFMVGLCCLEGIGLLS
jgi:hypothetical protein